VYTSPKVKDAISELIDRGVYHLIINLEKVRYIDSTGLGAVVMCATTLRKIAGVVKLMNLNRRNIELLVMTKLATVFEIFTDEQDAVNSFFPDRKLNTFDILSFVQDMKKKEE
jgi:anti-sigma B factor antagonist